MAGELQIYAPQQNWRTQIVARLGAGGPALATTATTGFTAIPTCAGTPSGVPDGGDGSMIVDSTNNLLYFYSGGAWRSA